MDIIDDIHELMKMSREELDEVLLNKKYNSALLRELVRRTLKVANEYKLSLELEDKAIIKLDKKTIELKNDIEAALTKFHKKDVE